MGLIFQQNYWWSKICFAVSFILGASVLLGHVHYSIDVFAAPFMTYTIFVIAKKFFPKEYASLAHQH
jgi:membrane-associated phospholipid phosphatase